MRERRKAQVRERNEFIESGSRRSRNRGIDESADALDNRLAGFQPTDERGVCGEEFDVVTRLGKTRRSLGIAHDCDALRRGRGGPLRECWGKPEDNSALPLRWSAVRRSRLRPGTRRNSRMFRVIRTRFRAFAWPAMSTSYGPMGVPATASAARTRPASTASSRSNSTIGMRKRPIRARFSSDRTLRYHLARCLRAKDVHGTIVRFGRNLAYAADADRRQNQRASGRLSQPDRARRDN